jgi:hypothetical protein
MTILCVGSLADETFRWTVSALRRGACPHIVLDLGLLATVGQIEGDWDDPFSCSIRIDDQHVMLSHCDAWVLRLIDLHQSAPTKTLATSASAVHCALTRMAQEALKHMPVVSPPPVDQSNFAKLLHLAVHAPGRPWEVPRSLLTNSIDEARDFIADCPEGAIFKGASAAKTWVSLATVEDLQARGDQLACCPVLFQENCKGADVRVHVVENACFAEHIDSDCVDYRRERVTTGRTIDLPTEIAEGCISLSAEMRVPLIGVDFKLTRDQRWVFLEANSMPCYQGYDKRANLQISSAIISYITGRM